MVYTEPKFKGKECHQVELNLLACVSFYDEPIKMPVVLAMARKITI